MTQSELEAALKAAFNQCATASHPLSDRQRQIVLQAVLAAMGFGRNGNQPGGDRTAVTNETAASNPLEQLTADERQAFLAFLKQQDSQNQPWKVTLLNDWLNARSSGAVQFIRERYGIQWLEQITPEQVAAYLNSERGDVLKLKVGDRIEVTNGLWEWVQETGPCSREWFPCIVVSVKSTTEDNGTASNGMSDTPNKSECSCIVRFEGGTEYEIQGIYDWNRPNWRWLER